MDAEVKQRRREKEQQAQEQRQAEEQQRLMAQRQQQEFFSQNLFTSSLPNPSLASLPTPYIPFSSFPSIKYSLEDILDLTVQRSSPSSQVSTQADLGVDSLSRQPEPMVDDFNLEVFIQEQQQQQPQQESQATQESSSARDTELLDMILSLNSFITPPSQTVPASSSSDAPLSVPMVLANSFSSNLSNFTQSLTPPSSSSSLSRISLSPTDQQMLPVPNSHCSSEAIIDVREVLNSMLQGGTESRQSVIKYPQPE